jgi:hypothetical protein
LVKLTHLLSGETATDPRRPTSVDVTVAVLPSATVKLYSVLSAAVNNNVLASGDQTSEPFSLSRFVIFFGLFPSGSLIQTSSRPDRSETNARYFPSGDHFGA